MKNLGFFQISMVFLFIIFLSACKKTEVIDSCYVLLPALDQLDSEEMKSLWDTHTIDLFPVSTMDDAVGHEENFEKLISRMRADCDQLEISMFCYACIETLPLKTELEIVYTINGAMDTVYLDVDTPEDSILLLGNLHK